MENFNLQNMSAENKGIRKYQAKAVLVTQTWKMELK